MECGPADAQAFLDKRLRALQREMAAVVLAAKLEGHIAGVKLARELAAVLCRNKDGTWDEPRRQQAAEVVAQAKKRLQDWLTRELEVMGDGGDEQPAQT